VQVIFSIPFFLDGHIIYIKNMVYIISIMKNNAEIWKTIIGEYSNYEISSHGRIKNKTSGKILNITSKLQGFYRVNLRNKKKRKGFLIHKLVDKYFLPEYKGKYIVEHVDGNKTNNNVNNLKRIKINSHTIDTKYNKITKNDISKILEKYDLQTKNNKEWRQIEFYDNYIISSYGEVFNTKNGKFVKYFLKKSGYNVLSLYKNKKTKLYNVHILTMNNFSPNINKKDNKVWHLVHVDGDKQNNKVSNLKWIKFTKDVPKKTTLQDISETDELWKKIDDFPNYMISNLGRLLNIDRMKLRALPINKSGYIKISLSYKNTKGYFVIHRLVALAFIENTNNYPVVNHLNGIKHDNRQINLEWTTHAGNIQHAFYTGLIKPSLQRKGRLISQYTTDGKFIKKWNSVKEASIDTKISCSKILWAIKKNIDGEWRYDEMEHIPNEIWKPVNIKDLEHYKISNMGRIIGQHGRLMYQNKGTGEYFYVGLTYKNSKSKKTMSIHRLVALTFIKNPKKYKIVNHIDGDKCNNIVSNLEWCTTKMNATHAIQTKLCIPKKRPVNQLTLDGKFIKKWNAVSYAAKYHKISDSSICGVCKGKKRTAAGFKWKYVKI